uniref:RING-type domain-containing protein n=1 Tax=Nelumbo nucifera TaxID=4432 RepID=A0A822XNY8_NELNU|nr:TPA_asm: hypothetical protein HUJ06_022876 [Nelumbo nucifera]
MFTREQRSGINRFVIKETIPKPQFFCPVACLAAIGLKKKALRQIPVVVYGSGSGKSIQATELGEFVDGDKIRVFPKCSHGFHVKCIDTWLVAHSLCPTCRHSLLDRPTTSDAEDADERVRPPEGGSGRQGGIIVVVSL